MWLANIILAIACNNSFAVLAYICVLLNSRFFCEKKISGIGLYQKMNMAIKMVVWGDER